MTAELRLGSNVVELRAKARKPRILIAGEFSSGKTRLINGLLGGALLPSNVTSTSLPPMWIVQEPAMPFRLDRSGTVQPFEGIGATRVEDTAFCLLAHDAPILEHMDLIDTPGNSDPNIPAEAWERMLGYADAVLWCSNAVQAWRQSEKSVWSGMPEHLLGTSTMLITHADRLTEAGSAERVMRRVKRDAAPFFGNFLMGSLIDQTDIDAVAQHLMSLCAGLRLLPGTAQGDVEAARNGTARPAPAAVSTAAVAADGPVPADRGIRPRRIRPDARRDDPATDTQQPAAFPVAPAPFMLTEAVRVAPALQAPEPAELLDGPAADAGVDLWPEMEAVVALATTETADTPVTDAAAEPAFDSAAFQSLFAQIVTDSSTPDPAQIAARPFEAADPDDCDDDDHDDDLRDARDDHGFDDTGVRFVQLARPATVIAGPARALWQQIARDYDLSDHQTLADCVELLIEEMDEILADAEFDGLVPSFPQPVATYPDDMNLIPLRLGQVAGRREH